METKSPSSDQEQPHAPGYAGCQLSGKPLCRIGPGGAGGYQVDHDTEICPCSKEDQWTAGLHQTKYCHQAEGADPCPLLTTGEIYVLRPVQLGSPVQERHTHTGARPLKGCKNDERIGISDTQRVADRARTIQARAKRIRMILPMCISSCLGSKDDGVRAFSVVLSDSKRGKRYKLKYRKFLLK